MDHDQYCQQVCLQSRTNFRIAFLFLGKPRRRALIAFYAFCREVDNIVDECSDPVIAAAKIDWWRFEIERLYNGAPTHPVTCALAKGISTYDLPQALFEEILNGMEMDLLHNRYPDFKSLQVYCHRVAGVVGHISALIFGISDDETIKYAHNLGLALQLTNIIRDIGEDARRGRIYIPDEDLQSFEISADDILSRRQPARFNEMMAFQIERAEQYYQKAWRLLPPADRRAQRPGIIMGAIYHALLQAIAEDPGLVLTHRISIPPGRKFMIALRVWFHNR